MEAKSGTSKNANPPRKKSTPNLSSNAEASDDAHHDPGEMMMLEHPTLLPTVTAIGETAASTVEEMTNEIGEFAIKRMAENMAITTELMQCSSPQELFALYSGYGQRMIQQYFDEGQALTAIGDRLLSKSTASLEEVAGRH